MEFIHCRSLQVTKMKSCASAKCKMSLRMISPANYGAFFAVIRSMKQLFIVLMMCVSLFACAQSKTVVKRVYSFYTERAPGNIMRDGKSGEEVPVKIDTILTVYVET